MGYVIKMPKLGLEMEEGTVLEWKVERGESFEEGDVLAEVESEKSIGEVEAREDGALRRVYVEEGETVPPSTPIAIAAAPDADISDLEAEAEAELAATAPEAAPADVEAATATAETGGDAASAGEETGTGGGGTATGGATDDTADVKVSPRAERRAEELGVDLTTVEGTGFEGAVTEEDVEAAAEAAEEETEPRASPRAKKRAEELGVDLATVEGTGFEGAITEEDVEAAAEAAEEATAGAADAAAETAAEMSIPPAAGDVVWIAPDDEAADRYHRTTAVADPAAGAALFETMEAVRTAFEERVTMTDILLAVSAATLSDHPVLNGTYTESTHQVQERRDIALVTDVNGGRAVGVISEAGHRSLSELVDARRSIGGGDSGADGATFTLTNAAETDATGRLANPPAVAALAVDPTGQRAVPDGDGVDIQPLVTASLTYDSHAVGAGEAQAFLTGFFQRAENAPEIVLGSYRGRE